MPTIAIIGGGFAGTAAALRLAEEAGFQVTLFDQGRRGVGGRASHRRIDASSAGGSHHHGSTYFNKFGGLIEGVNPLPSPDDGPPPIAGTYEFDHGCQFFRAETDRFKAMVKGWVEQGICAEWNATFAALGSGAPDFFGFDGQPGSGPFYVGVGGNHLLPRALAAKAVRTATDEATGPVAGGAAAATSTSPSTPAPAPQPKVVVKAGVRVASMDRIASSNKWRLQGVDGEAAYHDTAERVAGKGRNSSLGEFDAVMVTDISTSFESWHRASAGVPEAVAAQVRHRVRVPLFAAMVGFASPGLGPDVPDAIVFGGAGAGAGAGDGAGASSSAGGGGGGEGKLWYAARTRSKPGYNSGVDDDGYDDGGANRPECWTLVSTPGFAASEIESTTMRDATTGAFKPQDNQYLNTGPAPALLATFAAAVTAAYINGTGDASTSRSSSSGGGGGGGRSEDNVGSSKQCPFPKATYLQGQRWGSAFPAPAYTDGRDRNGVGPTTKTILDVQYETATPRLRATPAVAAAAAADAEYNNGLNYVFDDELQVYYAGDYCSRHTPGVEAAVLSATDAASHIIRVLA